MKMKLVILVTIISMLFCKSYGQQTSADIHYLTDTTADFNQLISKFKGSIVYVDVWATWCGPCRHELQAKEAQEFRKFAAKHNIIQLYICADKNNKSWKGFINQNRLNGYHVLWYPKLDSSLHNNFSYTQRMNGQMKKGFYLPRHILIGQNSRVVDSLADWQGSKALYAQLKLLEKNSSVKK